MGMVMDMRWNGNGNGEFMGRKLSIRIGISNLFCDTYAAGAMFFILISYRGY